MNARLRVIGVRQVTSREACGSLDEKIDRRHLPLREGSRGGGTIIRSALAARAAPVSTHLSYLGLS